jgi:hypothetical protein
MRKDEVQGETTMFFQVGSPSGNHGIMVKHHPWTCEGELGGIVDGGEGDRLQSTATQCFLSTLFSYVPYDFPSCDIELLSSSLPVKSKRT